MRAKFFRRTRAGIVRALGSAFACLFFAGPLQAASVAIELTEVRWGGGQEYAPMQVSGTATGIYDTVANTVTMDSGTLTITHPIGPSVLWWHYMDDAVWDLNASAASFNTWECVDGPFADALPASVCGSIGPGTDNTLESTVDYSTMPGTRSIIGDDEIVGDQQQYTDYNATLASWTGVDLIINSLTWNDQHTTDDETGYQLIFSSVVPIPAAAWLFVSALGLLGWMRRKAE